MVVQVRLVLHCLREEMWRVRHDYQLTSPGCCTNTCTNLLSKRQFHPHPTPYSRLPITFLRWPQQLTGCYNLRTNQPPQQFSQSEAITWAIQPIRSNHLGNSANQKQSPGQFSQSEPITWAIQPIRKLKCKYFMHPKPEECLPCFLDKLRHSKSKRLADSRQNLQRS